WSVSSCTRAPPDPHPFPPRRSSDLVDALPPILPTTGQLGKLPRGIELSASIVDQQAALYGHGARQPGDAKITFGTGAFALALTGDRKSTRLNSSHVKNSYAVFCLKK